MLALGQHTGRQHAHDIIYETAMESFEQRVSFGEVLKRNPAVTAHLSPRIIDSLLDPSQYTGLAGVYVDQVTGEKLAIPQADQAI
jgi:adenylosuccinate lyase